MSFERSGGVEMKTHDGFCETLRRNYALETRSRCLEELNWLRCAQLKLIREWFDDTICEVCRSVVRGTLENRLVMLRP